MYNALLEHGWDWNGNKFSLFDFSGQNREIFPLDLHNSIYESIPIVSNDISVEKFPGMENDSFVETTPETNLDLSIYNPIPSSDDGVQILVIGGIVILFVVAIALIPSTGGASARLLFLV